MAWTCGSRRGREAAKASVACVEKAIGGSGASRSAEMVTGNAKRAAFEVKSAKAIWSSSEAGLGNVQVSVCAVYGGGWEKLFSRGRYPLCLTALCATSDRIADFVRRECDRQCLWQVWWCQQLAGNNQPDLVRSLQALGWRDPMQPARV